MQNVLRLFLIAAVFAGCSKTSTSYINNPNAPDHLHNRPVGASARELLAANPYSSLKIEIQYMPGFAPDPAALNHLQATLSTLLNKPSGITIVTNQVPASGNLTLNADNILEIERNNRTSFTAASQISVYVLYTNGNYTEGNVLGIAYRNTSVALFGKKIHDNSGAIGQTSRTKLEATVLVHELGHLLGLVDLGSPMQTNHKDAAHGNHCNNTSCIMHYASETTDILGFLLTGNIPSFDVNCRTDMQANGGL